MTTPYQAAPDGAIVVGGGTWNYGQTLDEGVARAAFEFPMPTLGNMLDLLRIALEGLPVDALKPFANFLGLVDGVFDNIANAVNDIVESLVERVFHTVADFNTFLTTLFTNPGSLIGNLFNVVMDGIHSIGDFLKKLWDGLTGNTGTTATKTVENVATAASGIKTTLGATTTTADGARDNLQLTLNELYDAFDGTTTPTGTSRSRTDVRGRGSNVRTSAKTGENYYYAGANMLINPGFEDTSFPILNNGVGVTANVGTGDLARTGTRSLKLVAGAGYPYSYLAASSTSQVYFPTSPTEKYYLECWVRGKATNTQVTASTGIALGITTFDTAKATPVNVAVSFPSGTDTISSAWVKISATVEVPAGKAFFTPYVQINSAVVATGETFYFDDVVVREVTDAKAASAAVVATNTALYGTPTPAATVIVDAVPTLTQNKVTGLPDSLLPVSQTLIDHAQDILNLKADREVTVNQGRTMSISFVQQPNSSALPTTGNQTWSTQYLTGSGPTFGIASGKAAWVGSAGSRTAKVLYRGAASRTLISTGTAGTFTLTLGGTTTSALAYNATAATVLAALGAGNVSVSGTSVLSPGLTITPVSTVSGALSVTSSVTGGTATLSDGLENTLTDYQSLRGVLADPPGIFGNESSGFTALARVSQDSNSYVFARAYWQAGLNLKGKIGYVNNGVETVWQDLIPLTWSTELTFRLGVDDNPRSYQVFSGSTLVVSYNEGYLNFASFPTTGQVTTRTYVDNTGNRLIVTGTAGTFTLSVVGVTTAAIAFNATAATVATALNNALNTLYATTGVAYATVTGTAANTAGNGLVVTFSGKVKGVVAGNVNLSVNPAALTGGSATVTNRYTWNGSAYVASYATTGVGSASSLGASSRRFGAEVRQSGTNNSGTISSVAVSDNPPVIYAGSVARMTRLNTAAANLATNINALGANFFDNVEYESLDIDATLSDGTFTVTKSKMYMVTGRIRLNTFFTSLCYAVLQRYGAATGVWSSTQNGDSVWPYDSFHNVQATDYALSGTWLQYLNAGDKVRLATFRDLSSGAVLIGSADSRETYFSISALQ